MPDLTQPIEFSFILKTIGVLIALSAVGVIIVIKRAKR